MYYGGELQGIARDVNWSSVVDSYAAMVRDYRMHITLSLSFSGGAPFGFGAKSVRWSVFKVTVIPPAPTGYEVTTYLFG